MALDRTEKVLAILASVATIAAGVLGIYFLITKEGGWGGANASSQQVVSKTTQTDGPATDQQNPDLKKKDPSALPGTEPYFEDFIKVKEGRLPDGWEGDDAIVVVKSGDRPRLEVNGQGLRAVTLKRVTLTGNFAVEWQASNGTTTAMNVILQGKSGKDLIVRTSHAGGGHDWLFAALGESELKVVGPVVQTGNVAKFRLEREDDVFRLLVNGTSLHVQRVKGYSEFTRIRFELPGAPGTKLYSIKVASL